MSRIPVKKAIDLMAKWNLTKNLISKMPIK
jgi:hypothetical protein